MSRSRREIWGTIEDEWDPIPEEAWTMLRVHPSVKVIFLTGFKHSGKTTVAEMLLDYLERDDRYSNHIEILPFVSIVKGKASMLFGVDREWFYETELKDKTIEQWPYDTPRNLLLKLADTLLQRWPDIWTHPWKLRAQHKFTQGLTLLVPDLRLMQEWSTVLEVRNNWGIPTHVIRVKRPVEPLVGPTTHITERFVNDFPYDLCIMNEGTLEDLRRDVYRVYLNIFKPESITLERNSQ